jgi:hypothetical protein
LTFLFLPHGGFGLRAFSIVKIYLKENYREVTAGVGVKRVESEGQAPEQRYFIEGSQEEKDKLESVGMLEPSTGAIQPEPPPEPKPREPTFLEQHGYDLSLGKSIPAKKKR